MNLLMLSPGSTGAESRWRGVSHRITAWMAVGLLVAGVASLFTTTSPDMLQLIHHQGYIFALLLLLQLGAAITLSRLIGRLPTWLAIVAFLAYSALNGLSLAGMVLTATGATEASPVVAFFATAGAFAVLSMYGRTTGRDFTKIDGLVLLGMIGAGGVSLVQILLHAPVAAWIVSYLGVGVCVGLSAIDAPAMKHLDVRADELRVRRLAILGALVLYLDLLLVFAKLGVRVLKVCVSYTNDYETSVPRKAPYIFY